MTLTQLTVNHSARWSVMWWSDKRGEIVEKKFHEDFTSAKHFYAKVKATGRKLVTLRCTNVGIPPAPRLRDHTVTKYRVKKVLRKGKRVRRKIPYEVEVKPMEKLNAKGVWWCPYCAELRRFSPLKYKRKVTYHCPVCNISTRDFNVRRWNPEALVLDFRRIRQKGSKRRRRRAHT